MSARDRCRGCLSPSLEPVLDHGDLPLADGFVEPGMPPAGEPRFPVQLALCGTCGLAQLLHTVPRTTLFGEDYPYFSSYSDSWLSHARRFANAMIEALGLDGASRVVEIASNDGYLLRQFVERGIPCLGVEPTPGPAAAARALGIETRGEFFDERVAADLVGDGWRADLVVANNVLAHVEDLQGFVAGVASLLSEDGVAAFEFGYLGDLFEQLAWDTLYHEHLCVFSLAAVQALLARHDLVVRSVQRLPTQGGSLRILAARSGDPDDSVQRLLAEERTRGLADPATHRDYGQRVRGHARRLHEFLAARVAEGRRIVGYGAAAKGTVLLNVARIGPELVPVIADRNPHKQGKLVPGVRIPIVAPSALREHSPDDLLILPWNLRDEIIRQESWLGAMGGAYLLPLPQIETIER